MRKYLYYVKNGDHTKGHLTGEIRVQEKPLDVNKGEEVELDHLDTEAEKSATVTYVGLGYKDFDSKEDYEEKIVEVIDQKMNEVEIEADN